MSGDDFEVPFLFDIQSESSCKVGDCRIDFGNAREEEDGFPVGNGWVGCHANNSFPFKETN